MPNRYARTKLNSRPIDQHRKVMQLALGRPLERLEYVHHINGDKWDNRLENLEVMDPATHAVHHLQKYPVTKICEVCGSTFTPHKTKRERAKNCGSEECKAIYRRSKIANRKLSDGDMEVIRARRAAGELLTSIAADFGVSSGTISAVAKGYRNYAKR